jgi:hypothetical protein
VSTPLLARPHFDPPTQPAHAQSPSFCAAAREHVAPYHPTRRPVLLSSVIFVWYVPTDLYRRAPLTRSPLSVPQGRPPARTHDAVGMRYGCPSMTDDSAWGSRGAGMGGGLTILSLARTCVRFTPAFFRLVRPILPSLSDLQLTGSVPSTCDRRVVIEECRPGRGYTAGMASAGSVVVDLVVGCPGLANHCYGRSRGFE